MMYLNEAINHEIAVTISNSEASHNHVMFLVCEVVED